MENDKTLTLIVRTVLSNVIEIVLIFLLFIFLWFLYFTNSEKTYEAKAVLIFSDDDVVNFSEGYFPQSRIDLNEKVLLFKSRSNIQDVIEKLNLSYKVNNLYQIGPRAANYYKSVEIELNNGADYIEFYLDLNADSFSIFEDKGKQTSISEDLQYGIRHIAQDFSIKLERDNNVNYLNDLVSFEYINEQEMIKKFQKALKVSQIIQPGVSPNVLVPINTLQVIISDPDKVFAVSFLENLIESYKEDTVRRKSTQAVSSINFLNSSIGQVEKLLIDSQIKLENFQKENGYLDGTIESTSLATRLGTVDEKINELQLNLIDAESRYSSESINSKRLKSQLDLLDKEKSQLLTEISMLPTTEQAYINLLRDITVNQNLLESLLNMRLEFSLTKASTISDLSIGEYPYITSNVNPKPLTTLIYFFVLGAVATVIFLIVKVNFFNKLRYSVQLKELAENRANTQLIGVIPKSKESQFENLDGKDLDIMGPIATNLTLEMPKRIVVTGPTKAVGKTYSSYVIGNLLANAGKKVLLIDLDLRQGDLGKLFNKKKKTLEDFFDIENNLEQYKSNNKNLYVFPGIRSISSIASSFFASEETNKVLDSLSNHFDIIIFDTAPLLSISDTFILIQKADAVIVVSRQGLTFENDLNELLNQVRSVSDVKIKLLFNGLKRQFNLYAYSNYDYYYKRYYEKNYDYQSKE